MMLVKLGASRCRSANQRAGTITADTHHGQTLVALKVEFWGAHYDDWVDFVLFEMISLIPGEQCSGR